MVQGVEDRSRPVAVGKQLAVFFFVESDAELFEKACCMLCGIGAQDVTDDPTIAAPEVPFCHDAIGNVAPPAAADENLRPNRFRPIHAHDAARRDELRGEQRSREPRCTTAYHQDVCSIATAHSVEMLAIPLRSAGHTRCNLAHQESTRSRRTG